MTLDLPLFRYLGTTRVPTSTLHRANRLWPLPNLPTVFQNIVVYFQIGMVSFSNVNQKTGFIQILGQKIRRVW